jgi:HMG-box domain
MVSLNFPRTLPNGTHIWPVTLDGSIGRFARLVSHCAFCCCAILLVIWTPCRLAKIIGQRWKALSQEGRDFYRDVARTDRERYKQYQLNQGRRRTVPTNVAALPQPHHENGLDA